ncbi:ferrous iron transporter B, partial [Staphylococcus aureus]|nr:ferrous iron transporter B [Staphylococcus aureus]
MSCSARLPVYLLLAGAFFPIPWQATLILFSLYIIGVLMAVISARLLKTSVFKGEDIPFVMELPPYRRPTVRSVAIHV